MKILYALGVVVLLIFFVAGSFFDLKLINEVTIRNIQSPNSVYNIIYEVKGGDVYINKKELDELNIYSNIRNAFLILALVSLGARAYTSFKKK